MKKLGIGCLGIIGIFVIIGIIMAAVGGGGEEETVSSENEDVTGSETENVEEADTATDEDGEQAVVFSMNENVEVGEMDYQITDMETTDSVGDEFVSEDASGIYVLLTVQATNNGSDAVTISEDYVKLILEESTYEADSIASTYANEDGMGLFLEQINPGSTTEGVIAFDVTEDVANNGDLQAQVQEGIFGSNTAIVDLD